MPARIRREQFDDMLAGGFAPHPLEHVRVDVLEGDVDVAGDLGALGDGLDQFVGPMGRVGVEQPNPEIAGQAFSSRSRVQMVVAAGGKRS